MALSGRGRAPTYSSCVLRVFLLIPEMRRKRRQCTDGNPASDRSHQKLEDVSRGTTLNFTLLKAGERDNIIPSHAEATADLRVVDKSEIDRVEKAAQAIAARPLIPQTTVEVHVKRGNPPFAPNTGTDQLIALAQKIYGELGKTLITRSVGGASDANWAADAGAVAVDCFGAVKGGKNHTPQECASVSSVVPRMYLLSRMFMELGKGTAVKGVS